MKKDLQNGEIQDNLEPDTCGGLPKPPDKIGEIGAWTCEGTQWAWIPAV